MGLRTFLLLIASLVCAAAALADPGELDPSWGHGGAVRTRLSRDGSKAAIVFELSFARGRLVAAGGVPSDGASDNFLIRYLPTGRLDRSFGSGGIVRGAIRGLGRDWQASLLGDGRVLLGGPTIGRLRADGRLDPRFGTNGRATIAIGRCRYRAGRALQEPNGRILVSTRSCRDGARDDGVWDIARLLPGGRLDRSFGHAGVAHIPVGSSNENPYTWGAEDLVRRRDGSIVAAGGVGLADGRFAIAVVKLTPAGRLDRGFGTGGIAIHRLQREPSFGDLILRSDGTVLLSACDHAHGEPGSMFVAAFRRDGTPDGSWGTSGVVRLEDRLGVSDTACGNLVEIGGRRIFLLMHRLALLSPSGRLVASFGDRGVLSPRVADDLALAPGRRVFVAGGVALPGQTSGLAVFRYVY